MFKYKIGCESELIDQYQHMHANGKYAKLVME